MMLEVFPDDDLRSTAHDRKKIESLQWQNQSKRGIICKTQRNMNVAPLTIKKDAPPWRSGTIVLTTILSSTPTLAFPYYGHMFVIGADTSRIGISVILKQDDRLLFHTEAFPTLHSRLLNCKGMLTMMLEVFPDDDLRSMVRDRKKIESLQWQNQSKWGIICKTQRNMSIAPLTMKKDAPPWRSGTIVLMTTLSSTPTLAFPYYGHMFVIGADTPRIRISIILMQDDRPLFRTEAFPTLHSRLLNSKGILVATEFKVWLSTGP
ncbi:hypothetical protein BHM03_00028093 [Ensete ventricosum]|nr:hypothetical protein BHM03_00028093 [Ensete ventricosum]